MVCAHGENSNVFSAICLLVCGYLSSTYSLRCTEETCPENLPYCSPVGCVFKCPKGSFTEGHLCKTDCGEKYILNNHCVDVCPKTAPFTQTEIITLGHQFIKLQYCKEICPFDTYIFENACVQSCPPDKKFADNRVCKSACPLDKYRRNVTVDDQLTAIECVSRCDYGHFSRDGYCVSTCYSHQVVYKGKCQNDCPPDEPIKDTVESGITFCKSNCTDFKRKYNQHGRCVNKCDDGLVSANGVCILKCPENLNFKYIDDLGVVHCQDQCNAASPGNLLEDGYCVSQCKPEHVVYQSTCIEHCPSNASVHVTDKDTRGIQHVYCRKNCNGVGGYVYNNTCVQICPQSARYLYRSICFQQCPGEAPYVCEYCTSWIVTNNKPFYHIGQCETECPDLVYHKKCVQSCPKKTYQFESSCLESCTKEAPYTSHGYCVRTCPYDTYPLNWTCTSSREHNCTDKLPYQSTNGACVSKCQSDQLIDGNKCIDETQCDKSIKFQGVCTDICPVGYVYQGRTIPQCLERSTVTHSMLFLGLCGVLVVVFMAMFLSTNECTMCRCKLLKSILSRSKQQSSIEAAGSDDEPLIIERV